MSIHDNKKEDDAAYMDAFFLPGGILDEEDEQCGSSSVVLPHTQSLSSSMNDTAASRCGGSNSTSTGNSHIPSNPWSSSSPSINNHQLPTMNDKQETLLSISGQPNGSVTDVLSLSSCQETVGIDSSRFCSNNLPVPFDDSQPPQTLKLASLSTPPATSSKSKEVRAHTNKNDKDAGKIPSMVAAVAPQESDRPTQQTDSKSTLAVDASVPLHNNQQSPKQSGKARGATRQQTLQGDSRQQQLAPAIFTTLPSQGQAQRSHDDGSSTQVKHSMGNTEKVPNVADRQDPSERETKAITGSDHSSDGSESSVLEVMSSTDAHSDDASETSFAASQYNNSTEPQHCNQENTKQTRNNVESGEDSTAAVLARVRRPCSTDSAPRSNVVKRFLDQVMHLLSSGHAFLRDRCSQIYQAALHFGTSFLQHVRMIREYLVTIKSLFHSLLAQLIALCTIVLLCCAKVLVLLGSIAVQMCKFSLWEAVEEPKVAICYAMFYFVPTFCTALMDIIDLPHWTPHLASMLAVLSFCSLLEPGPLYSEDTVKWGDVLQLTPHRSHKTKTVTKVPTGVLKTPQGSKKDDSMPRDVESCITILKFLPRLLPLFFLVDGFSTECGTMIGLLGTNRLTTAFMMSMVRKKLVSSPVAWISWALQILVATYHSSFVLVDLIVLVLGLSSIRWIRYLEDRRTKGRTRKRF